MFLFYSLIVFDHPLSFLNGLLCKTLSDYGDWQIGGINQFPVSWLSFIGDRSSLYLITSLLNHYWHIRCSPQFPLKFDLDKGSMIKKNRKKLVVIGNGMAGARIVEEILSREPDMFDISMFGAEPYGNYNRILLSNVLNKSQDATAIFMNPLDWYTQNHITLHAGYRAIRIDRENQIVIGAPMRKGAHPYVACETGVDADAKIEESYDYVIIRDRLAPLYPTDGRFSGKREPSRSEHWTIAPASPITLKTASAQR